MFTSHHRPTWTDLDMTLMQKTADVVGEMCRVVMSELTVPQIYSLQFLFKSTHHSGDMKEAEAISGCFFSEHSIELVPYQYRF